MSIKSRLYGVLGLLAACILFLAFAAPQAGKFSRFKAIEAYQLRADVLMIPTYGADGEVCELALERLHYSPQVKRMYSLTSKEIEEIVEELVPVDERGKKSDAPLDNFLLQDGPVITVTTQYEHITLRIYSQVLTHKKKTTVTGSTIGVVTWKGRACE